METGESAPMRKLSTGEPYAGKSHVRFGGKGDLTLDLPYPYQASRGTLNFRLVMTRGRFHNVFRYFQLKFLNLHQLMPLFFHK